MTVEGVLPYPPNFGFLKQDLFHDRLQWPQIVHFRIHDYQSRIIVSPDQRPFFDPQIVNPQELRNEIRVGERILKDLRTFDVGDVQFELAIEGPFAEHYGVAATDDDLGKLGRISIHSVRCKLELFSANHLQTVDCVVAKKSAAHGELDICRQVDREDLGVFW